MPSPVLELRRMLTVRLTRLLVKMFDLEMPMDDPMNKDAAATGDIEDSYLELDFEAADLRGPESVALLQADSALFLHRGTPTGGGLLLDSLVPAHVSFVTEAFVEPAILVWLEALPHLHVLEPFYHVGLRQLLDQAILAQRNYSRFLVCLLQLYPGWDNNGDEMAMDGTTCGIGHAIVVKVTRLAKRLTNSLHNRRQQVELVHQVMGELAQKGAEVVELCVLRKHDASPQVKPLFRMLNSIQKIPHAMNAIRVLRVASYFSRQNTYYHTLRARTIKPSVQQKIMDLRQSIGQKPRILAPIVLGLIAAGSKGPTRDQLLGFFKCKSAEQLNLLSSQLVTLLLIDGGPCLSFANGVWVDQSLTLKPAFKDVVENAYKAAPNHVDFQTKADEVRKEVNTWVEKQTNGVIRKILPSGSVDDATRQLSLQTHSIKVPFMTSIKKQYVCAFKDFKVLGLPYEQGKDKRKFSMYFFLPNLLEKFGSESEFIERHLPYQEIKVGVFRIPKFKINFDFEASEVLKGLGLVLPFSGGDGLREMVEESSVGKNLYVSSIFHKSFIEVNEEGTEAAGATIVCFDGCSMMIEEKLDFVADHPF
ncbi:hypothetical protein BUALT_Bualt08G0056800 [Buddleja alternifolia]|uniref:Serpin domain-containing protein n=1 Tax=Buddleja alternifolia TaxID=168488 RepID=A0AAV6X5H3_9LAMI|nr:hypothetical protein BUALT_Bualt08G0056800 [Buddleja alternifolia]